MRRLIFFSVLILVTSVNVAQITAIHLSEDVTIDRVYLGLDTKTNLKPSDLSNTRSVSLQTGVLLTNVINTKLKLRSYGALIFKSSTSPSVLSAYEIIFTPIKKLTMLIGVTSTPTTELRPSPTTWESQAETNAQTKIIGGRSGLKLRYHLGSKLIISYGAFNHDGVLVHHLKFDYSKLKIAGYVESDSLFLAFNYQNKNIEITTIYSQYKEAASSLFLNNSSPYSIFIDSVYDFNSQKTTKMEIGYRKYFRGEKTPLSGFFSLSYDPFFDKILEGRFIIHI